MSPLTGKARMKDVKASTDKAPPPDGHPAEAAKVVELAPGIVSDPGICGGDPTIAGTRIGVDDVAALAKLYDWDLDRVHAEEFPHLSAEQFRAAVDWYRGHEMEIEEILRRHQASYDRLVARTQASR